MYLTNEDYRFVYSRTPRLCVDLILANDDKFLLTKRAIESFVGLWHFPGGRVNYRESIEQAAHRIALKELGINITLGQLLGYCDIINDGEFVHSVSLVFTAIPLSNKITSISQSTENAWFSTPPDYTHPYHKKFLEWWFSK